MVNLLGFVVQRAAADDLEALFATMAIQALGAPLETLRQPSWPERFAAQSRTDTK